MAWQIGGADAFAVVAEADASRTSPGSAALKHLLDDYGPVLVLIDEWVAYARQLYDRDDLPAGTLDVQISFAQALTEAARASERAMVIISIPASEAKSGSATTESVDDAGSEIEVGRVGGKYALDRLRSVVGRMESSWRAATGEEAFEIVRRRLFEPLEEGAALAARDAIVDAFGDLYRRSATEFPGTAHDRSFPAGFRWMTAGSSSS